MSHARLPQATNSSSLAGRLVEQIKSSGQHKGNLNATELTALEATLRDEIPRNPSLQSIATTIVNDGCLLDPDQMNMHERLNGNGISEACPKETLDHMHRAVAEVKNQLSVLKKQEILIKKHLESLRAKRKVLEAHWQQNISLRKEQRKQAQQKIKESFDKLLLLSKREFEFESPHTYVEKCLEIVNGSMENGVENGVGDCHPEKTTQGIADDILDELCLIPGSEEFIQNAYLELVIERQEVIKYKLVRLYTCLEKINAFYDFKVSKNITQRQKTLQLIQEYTSNETAGSRDASQQGNTASTTSRNESPLDENHQINKDSFEHRFASIVKSSSAAEVAEDELDSLRKLLKSKIELATKNIPATN